MRLCLNRRQENEENALVVHDPGAAVSTGSCHNSLPLSPHDWASFLKSFQHTNNQQGRTTQPITDDENAKRNAFAHDIEQLQMTMKQNNQTEKVLDFIMQENVASARPPKNNLSAALSRRADSAGVNNPMVLSQTGKEANARVSNSGASVASPQPLADLGASVSTGSCPNSGVLSEHAPAGISITIL